MTQAQAPSTTPTLATGEKAPDFSLDIATNKRLSLADLTGKKVVLYFYPKDDTPGCTVEAKDFRDHMKDFESAGAVVLGVSKDDLASHDKFRQKFCLPFPLGADTDGKVCAAYGTWVEKSMYGKKYMGIQRDTFLIDPKGIIHKIWRKVSVDGHVAEVLVAVKAM